MTLCANDSQLYQACLTYQHQPLNLQNISYKYIAYKFYVFIPIKNHKVCDTEVK